MAQRVAACLLACTLAAAGAHAASLAPDGYTLLLGTTNLTVLPSMTKVEFDPVRDYVPVALNATASNIPLVHPSVGANLLQELLALAVTSTTRLPDFLELPTMAEAGLASYEASTWWGVLAPRSTPPPVVTKLNHAIDGAIAAGTVRGRIAALGAQPAGGSPEELARVIRNALAKWPRLIKEAGIRLD